MQYVDTNTVATFADVARPDTIYNPHRVLYVTEKATSRRHVLRTKTRAPQQREL